MVSIGLVWPSLGVHKPPTTPQRLEKVYDLPEGQIYIAQGPLTADYYWAKVWAATLPMASHKVVADSTQYYVVSFNHRLALVRAEDVTVVRTARSPGSGPERLTFEPPATVPPATAPSAPPPPALSPDEPPATAQDEIPGAMQPRDLRGLQ